MAKEGRDAVALSRFGVLVAQLESIVAVAAHQPPDALLCFDLLSDLLTSIDEELKDAMLLWQRKCEDALQSLLILGTCRPVRHLASVAMAKVISRGDVISIFARVSGLQGLLSDVKRNDPQQLAGAAQCLGELYKRFGKRITSGLLETTLIVGRLMKFHEEFVRQEALCLLQNALNGCGGSAALPAYSEAFRLIMRVAAAGDKSFIVRGEAARCLKSFADITGPGLGFVEIDNVASFCVKGLGDPVSSVRDTFAEALGAFIALGMNRELQAQPRGNDHPSFTKKLEGYLQKHLVTPFMKASGARMRDIRIGLTLSWVFFLQGMHINYLCPDSEIQKYALQAVDMISSDLSSDVLAMACVIYILRVGVINQMTELSQRSFLPILANLLLSRDRCPSMSVAVLRSVAYTLETLGEVPLEFKDVLDLTVVASLSHSSELVRMEASITLRVLAEVDPTCVGGLLSFGVTTVNALKEGPAFQKPPIVEAELDSLHGHANMLAALMTITPNLPLGYPARFSRYVLQMSKKMITESGENSLAVAVQKEAGWLLLASLFSSLSKEELEGQVFDILSLWAPLFGRNAEYHNDDDNLSFRIRVLSAAIGALTAFIRCFHISDTFKRGILLQPVLVYLSSALSYISSLLHEQLPLINSELDIFIIRTLLAYQSLPDPMSYMNDHSRLIHICTTPFRDPICDESSCLRLLLDKGGAWLGPWTPGRNRFEDELRYFSGEKSGMVPCVCETEISSFPLSETIPKTLVNQMLLCFGLLFASMDSKEMISLLDLIKECLKHGKKQKYRVATITNICVGLLSGLKSVLSLRLFPLGLEILNSFQAIFLSIIMEGDLCASQRRASAEGLGLLARVGSDIFTAKMTRLLLGELNRVTDSPYTGSLALALGFIHKSAGGMALSSLMPHTVNSISSLARNSVTDMRVWYLHSLVMTIEAAGLSYVSHVQDALGLALDILFHDENCQISLQQGIGRLVNAIVAVLGPEFSAGSVFFSRCKSIVTETCFHRETSTLLENVRFTQQLVLFAPHAASVHTHLQNLIPTLYSGQPNLRHLAITTLGHLMEKHSIAFIDLGVEYHLFHVLDEETDPDIVNMVRTAIVRLMYKSGPSRPSQWISTCHDMVLSASVARNNKIDHYVNSDASSNGNIGAKSNFTNDQLNMVPKGNNIASISHANNPSSIFLKKDKHPRIKTRLFAAECLSHLPFAVGENPAQFDLLIARRKTSKEFSVGDFLVLHVENLISLAYQISTMQFATMQPIGLVLLCTIVDKFGTVEDPDLPGHLLLEQYQAQFVSAVRTALNASYSPELLEVGLQLATKILTSRIISGDQAAVKRIFSLISYPLNDFKYLYYPSFAEWVSCKIKVRLLTAHASLKCYVFSLLKNRNEVFPEEYKALAPLISKISNILGSHWISILKDYCRICLHLNFKKSWSSFLDEIPSPQIGSKLKPCLEETWPVILHAVALDAVPVNSNLNGEFFAADSMSSNSLISRYCMVELRYEEFQFVLAFTMLVISRGQSPRFSEKALEAEFSSKFTLDECSPKAVLKNSFNLMKIYEIVLQVFVFLTTERFFTSDFLNVDIVKELLEVLYYTIFMKKNCVEVSIYVLSHVAKNSPDGFFENEYLSHLVMEVFLLHLLRFLNRNETNFENDPPGKDLHTVLFITAKTLVVRYSCNMHVREALPIIMAGYKFVEGASDMLHLAEVKEFTQHMFSLLSKSFIEKCKVEDGLCDFKFIFSICVECVNHLSKYCIDRLQLLQDTEYEMSELQKLLQLKLAFSLEHFFLLGVLAYNAMDDDISTSASSIFFTLFRSCINYFHFVVNSINVQVQAVGLQVLRSILQKSTNAESNLFSLFFVGEIFSNPFSVIEMIMKKPKKQESIIQLGECLRILMLLQNLCSTNESQKMYMKLLLEAAFMVLSVAGEGDLKRTTLSFVSQLALLPSSAVHLKDVFMSMPPTRRQQLQDIIAASMLHNQTVEEKEPSQPSSTISLPIPREVNQDYSAPMNSSHSGMSIDSEEEEDWDVFQSFPVSSKHEEEKFVCSSAGIENGANEKAGSTNGGNHEEIGDDDEKFGSENRRTNLDINEDEEKLVSAASMTYPVEINEKEDKLGCENDSDDVEIIEAKLESKYGTMEFKDDKLGSKNERTGVNIDEKKLERENQEVQIEENWNVET